MSYSKNTHPVLLRTAGLSSQGGFTLIEILTVVMIIGILAAIALPNYNAYVTRSALVEAFTNLSNIRVQMEQSYLDNRSYTTGCAMTPPTGKFFTYSVSNCTSTTYTWNAIGMPGTAFGYNYTIDQANNKTTTTFAGTAVAGKNCWLQKSASEC